LKGRTQEGGGKDGEENWRIKLHGHQEADDSPADIAVKLLKSAPELAWREFDRQALNCRRSFTSYHPMANRRFLGVNDKNVATHESLLSPWFGKKRGRIGVKSALMRMPTVSHS
jgi:hypothetical protein